MAAIELEASRGGLLADEPTWRGCLFDGSWRAAKARIKVVEPATGQTLAEVGEASAQEVAEIVSSAAAAQPGWGSTYPGDRAAILRRAAQLLEAGQAEVVAWIRRETGGIEAKALFELGASIEELYQAAALLIEPEGHVLSSQDPTRLSYARRVPRGVIGVITPWNFPLLLAMRSVAPALACGNGVVLKPDPQTPVVGGVLLCRLFQAAGLPPGVLGLVPGGATTGGGADPRA